MAESVTRMGTVDFLRAAAQLTAAGSGARLRHFREYLEDAELVLAAEELTWIGLEQGLGSGFWEPLAAACTRLRLGPEDPEHGGWLRIVFGRAASAA